MTLILSLLTKQLQKGSLVRIVNCLVTKSVFTPTHALRAFNIKNPTSPFVVISSKRVKVLYQYNEENVKWPSNNFLSVELEETRGRALCNYDKMNIFLRYVGDAGFQTGVGEDIAVLQTTVSKVVTEVADQIIEKCASLIKFPHTPVEPK